MKIILPAMLLSLSLSSAEEFALSSTLSPPVISLKSALIDGKENNLGLKKIHNQVSIASSAVYQSLSPLMPQLNLNASHRRDLLGSAASDGSKAGLSLSTALLDTKSLIALKGSREALASARLSYEHEANLVALNVANAYVDALMAQSLLVIAQEELEQFRKQLEVNKNMLHVGSARPLDVSRAEYLFNKSQSDLVMKERDLSRKLAVLGALINRGESFLVEDFELSSNYFTENPEVLLSLAQKSADVLALEKEYSSQSYSLISEGFDFMPKLSARIDSGWRLPFDHQGVSANPAPFAQIMFNLDLPLWSGGSSVAAIKKKSATRSSVDLSLRELRRDKHLSINGALEQINAYQMSLASAELALSAALKSKGSADRLFNAGEATALELVEANVNLVSAKNLAANAKLRLSQSKIKLLFLIGKMSEVEG
jgi:outer membrane protein